MGGGLREVITKITITHDNEDLQDAYVAKIDARFVEGGESLDYLGLLLAQALRAAVESRRAERNEE